MNNCKFGCVHPTNGPVRHMKDCVKYSEPVSEHIMKIRKATKKPVMIDFLEWTGENLLDVIRFTGQNDSAMNYKWEDYEDLVKREGLKIFTLEGSHKATIGDMIIRGVAGEFYPCKPDIFHATYNVQDA